ncbi:hypothetical protein [Billgrantia montanilacus]|uniref:hypothetical protein n=1 Tax=Billgrantia montanilacus TaxID=2282305 RepID=UPI0015F0D062|nr:hypothetical protein [Halomonas montanilacus]
MVMGLMWCLAVLVIQLGLLHYVDLRVAAMSRLDHAPESVPGNPPSTGREDGLDA